MKSPSLATLPTAPLGLVGWPWTEETLSPDNLAPGGSGRWPKITVVTPSYSQGQFIEETIRSVLLQGYPELEYIVIDGGSEDTTLSILEKYSSWLSYYVSEPDSGQSDALNKGFARATGTLCAYLNSDDIYLPGALLQVALRMVRVDQPDWLTTTVEDLYPSGLTLRVNPLPPHDLAGWVGSDSWIHQPGVFWKKTAVTWTPWFESEFRYVMDRAFFMRLCLNGVRLDSAPEVAAARFRLHDRSKTVSEASHFYPEQRELTRRYLAIMPLNSCRSLRSRIAIESISGSLSDFTSGKISRVKGVLNLIRLLQVSRSAALSRMYWGAMRRLLFAPRTVAKGSGT